MSTPAAGWILYDGACGICSKWVPLLAPTLKGVGLGTAPLQSPWVSERTGLRAEELVQDLRLLRSDGSLVSGAEAYRWVMRRVWWAWPLWLLSILPGGRQLFNWAYRTFAQHRKQLSDACGLEPGGS